MPSDIGRRIKAARLRKELSQSELSELCGWSQFPARISNYERGKREPKSQDLMQLAHALGVSIDWFYQESNAPELMAREPQVTYGNPRYAPLIPWEKISDHLCKQTVATDTFRAISHLYGNQTFALIVDNDTMVNPTGMGFPSGTIIVVDPDLDASTEDFALIQTDEKQYTFKQLVSDSGKTFLKPLNPRYPLMEMSPDSVVVGVVREAIQSLA